MGIVDYLVSVTYDATSPLIFNSSVIQGFLTSAITAAASLIFIAPLTARWVRWEEEKLWRNIRGRVKEEFANLISQSIEDLIHTYSYFEIFKEKPTYAYDCCDVLLIFSEQQNLRIQRFEEVFRNFNDALVPDERYEISRILSAYFIFDRQRLSSLSNAALSMMSKLKSNPNLLIETTGLYFEIRPLRQCITILPDFELLIFDSKKISGMNLRDAERRLESDKIYRAREKKNTYQGEAADFQVKITDYIANEVFKKDMMLESYIADTLDIPQLRERNKIAFSLG